MPRVNHIGFGLVLGLDGKRFRTRASDVVRLVDLLDEAKARSKQGLIDRGLYSQSRYRYSSLWILPPTSCAAITGREDEWDAEELELAAEALGYGAVKYEINMCSSL
jgi:arginyl-tRNA synthetase